MQMRSNLFSKVVGFLLAIAFVSPSYAADNLDHDETWSDIASDGKSFVFGRFIGKFETTEFRSRRVRLLEMTTGEDEYLEIDDALGYISATIPPGLYSVVGLEAVYYPRIRPFNPKKYRPIRQRFALTPKTGDAQSAVIMVPQDRPVYIGTIRASNARDGVVYKGHQLRVLDEYEDAFERLENYYPSLTSSLDHSGIVPARHFMLKPTRPPQPLERVVGIEDPIRQAREYIADGKYQQAVSWLETFMPASDNERTEAMLLVGEAKLGNREYPEAIEQLGEVLLIDPGDKRALRLLARAHALEGHLDDAQNLYEALVEIVPDDAEAHLHLGYLHALQSHGEEAGAQFQAAFQTDFDYLLNDFVPFFIAMREALEEDISKYVPPRIVKFNVPPPKMMESRRQSRHNDLAVLIDHKGNVIAAQIGAQATGSMPEMMISLVRAVYEPASLNGIPIPALVTMGPGFGVQ